MMKPTNFYARTLNFHNRGTDSPSLAARAPDSHVAGQDVGELVEEEHTQRSGRSDRSSSPRSELEALLRPTQRSTQPLTARRPIEATTTLPRTSEGRILQVHKLEGNSFALDNVLAVNPRFFAPGSLVIVNEQFVFTAAAAPDGSGPDIAGAAAHQRQWARWSVGDRIDVRAYDPRLDAQHALLDSLIIDIEPSRHDHFDPEPIDEDALIEHFTKRFGEQVVAKDQPFRTDFRGIYYKMTVAAITGIDLGPRTGVPLRGILTRETRLAFRKTGLSKMRLSAPSSAPPRSLIVQPDFKFEDMGIGGLDQEFHAIFRRAFVSRILPSAVIERMGIPHVRGLLLYGPPGTGKTLMARQIGKLLNAREPKIVNGPEILNKFVGQSEENVRKLFADAEAEYKEKGDESGLHIIIFDELDAVCKQRGGAGSGTGVGDSVVNQLLAKIDGVEQLNNILIIGMTNRLDMIDEALIRPGRLEVHVEVPLPDAHGRLQILNIHTAKMRENKIIGDDVSLSDLAQSTKNFSGAEIGGLIKNASSYAMNRHVKGGTVAATADNLDAMQVTGQDFAKALNEIQPAFGVSEADLAARIDGGILRYSTKVDKLMADGTLYVDKVRNAPGTARQAVLFTGGQGAGTTAMAAHIAMESRFPFIKLVTPETMIGLSEVNKIACLQKVFSDSYKSPQSVVVIDDIERIIDWTPIGPRFSNGVLQALMVLIRKQPPKGRKLLILATTGERVALHSLRALRCFDAEIAIPSVRSRDELEKVMCESAPFSERERRTVVEDVAAKMQSLQVGIGIKRILSAIDAAKQDTKTAARFIEIMEMAIDEQAIDEREDFHSLRER